MTQELIPRLGVGAIIIRDGLILLGIRNVDDNRGKWELCGGLVKPEDATARAAIKREVREEAGIEIEPTVIVADYSREFEDKGVRNFGFCYICQHVSGEAHKTVYGRIASFKWVTLDEGLTMELTPYTRLQLEQYKAWHQSV